MPKKQLPGHSLSPKQLKAVELLATGEMTQVEVASHLKVAQQTLSKWKKNPLFMELVTERSRELLKEALPEIYKALTKKGKAGHDRHIKIYLEHLEKLEEVKAQRAHITFTWEVPTITGDK